MTVSFQLNFYKIVLQNLHRESVINDVCGRPLRAMDVISISIRYFKDIFMGIFNDGIFNYGIGENDIDFVLTVPANLGDEGIPFLREAAIKVRCIIIEHDQDMKL